MAGTLCEGPDVLAHGIPSGEETELTSKIAIAPNFPFLKVLLANMLFFTRLTINLMEIAH